MIDDPSTITIALAGLGGASTVGVWMVKQASRVTTLETMMDEREKMADERHADIKEDLKLIRAALGVASPHYPYRFVQNDEA